MTSTPHYTTREILSQLNGNARAIGAWGEQYALNMLRQNGYTVVPSNVRKHGDLMIIGVGGEIVAKVEIKTARQASDRRWHFTLEKAGCTSAAHSDIVILIAVGKISTPTLYIIPTMDIPACRQICISSWNYNGKYAGYRQHWRELNLGGVEWKS